jgi:predicted AlkP superfamily phosphohydrolase/phosphomutase
MTTATVLILLSLEDIANAYIGPGAGFALISSFFVILITCLLAFLTIITWPVRAGILYFKYRKIRKRSRVKRVIVVGLDGFDPGLVQRFMDENKLPNFMDLKQKGSFRPLRTTVPSISPVAWATFSTGVNPGKHRIFDFYTRDPKNYMPVLSSAKISYSKRHLKIGPFRFPLRKAKVEFLRKSRSFWKILGEHGIFSSILRVPITFPPEKFNGACLSAMCTPDLLGTQGTFTLFTTEPTADRESPTSGTHVSLHIQDDLFQSRILGPVFKNNGSGEPLGIPIEGKVDLPSKTIRLAIGRTRLQLKEGDYSPWIRLEFKVGLRKRIYGVVRFLVTEMVPHLKIYMTPINIDPEKPALPISHPFYYSMILSKLFGPFATLGLAEDTWALNARVIDEGAFLEQAYDIYEERKRHLLDTLRKRKDGLVVSVFDTTDRIQHMFFRYLTPDHPANIDKDTTVHQHAIERLYQKMDGLIGEIQQIMNKEDLLMVISDHGFKPFKWGVNLNSWLFKEGYLVLKDTANPGGEWFAGVDWARTRAFAYGLTGIFLNVRGREIHGLVEPKKERIALQNEIKKKLESLWIEKSRPRPIRRVLLAQEALKGPYTAEAPDLLVCYEEGFRTSWDSAIGKITGEIMEDNTRSWSGDHCIDPDLVPGVFFSNRIIDDQTPAIEDIAPTLLNLFGLRPYGFHDGKILKLLQNKGEQL